MGYSFDASAGSWQALPTTRDPEPDGTAVVGLRVHQLGVFGVMELPTVTRVLRAGVNPVTLGGVLSTTAEALVSELGSDVESLARWDSSRGAFDVYVPGAPETVNRQSSLDPRDAIVVRLAPGSQRTWVRAVLPGAGTGERITQLPAGLHLVGFTGATATTVQELLAGEESAVVSAQLYDSALGDWRVWLPGAPALVNTLVTIDPYDVIYLRLSGDAVLSWREASD